MTTIHDFSDADGAAKSGTISLETFMAARTNRRSAEAASLAAMRNAFAVRMERTRADHLARAERLFSDAGLSRIERAGLLRTHRETMHADVAAIRLERDKLIGRDRSSSRLGRWINDRATTIGDRQDYLHVLKSAYEDGGSEFDPVLLAIPRSRRRREGAMAVYSVRDGTADREIFRVLPDCNEVVMRSTDERALEAAMVKAHHEFGPPLTFTSDNPTFISRCTAIAERYGYAVAEARGQANETPTATQQSSGPQSAPGASEPRRESGEVSPVKLTPDVSLDSHDAFKLSLTESYGLDHFMTLAPESKLTLRGRFIGAVDHPDNTNYYVAAIETAAGITLVAVDRQSLESIETDTEVTLRGVDGRWDLEGQAREIDMPPNSRSPEQSSDEHRGRGR